ncbi:MAG: NuoI/complex I 23 kDa subunit family protein [Planctomycetota bacterium]|jgi:NADH-quinone oxidoreductase subunit I
MGYWGDIWNHTKTITTGMGLTLKYLVKPEEIVTVQYPHEADEIPERHRGIHYLETDICIVCYQCSRACPVDCIEIEGTRAPIDEGTGLYPAAKGGTLSKFTIDYSRCIFCNLCIEPCPVDCIHMGKEFDYSGYTRAEMVKNLLTDGIFSADDQAMLNTARVSVDEADARAAEAKKKAAAEKKAAMAAKKAAAAAAKAAAEKAESESTPSAAKAEAPRAPAAKKEAVDAPAAKKAAKEEAAEAPAPKKEAKKKTSGRTKAAKKTSGRTKAAKKTSGRTKAAKKSAKKKKKS